MKKARSRASVKGGAKKPDITEKTVSIARHALQLEVNWLREKEWTDNEIRGLWSRLLREYESSSARVRARQHR